MKRFLHAGERYALLCIKILFNYNILFKSKRFMAVLAGVGASASALAASALVPAVAIVLNLMCFQVTLVNATALDARGEGAVIISSAESFAQQTVLTGSVVDTAGRPMLGVSVAVKGTRTQIMTSAEGKFTIQSSDSSGELVASFIGYKSVAVSFGPDAGIGPFKMVLVPLEQTIEEVVIDGGYYETTKRLSTGNIAKVDAATIARQPVTNPLQALNGQVSGVRLIQSQGLPNHPISVEIRGRNSIRSGNEPLYIVDGVPYNAGSIIGSSIHGGISALSSVNPNDIESISILKDADATAIYGSRGANGVVLISTKRARTNKTTLEADVAKGYGRPTRLLEPLSTEQYLQVRKDAFKNSGIEPTAANAPDLVLWDHNLDNKLQELFVGNTVERLNSSLSLTGGAYQTMFKLSGNYHQESSVFSNEDLYRRGNIHFTLNHKFLDDKMNLNFASFISKNDNRLSGRQTTNLNNIGPFVPNYPLYDENGNYNWIAGKTNYLAQAQSKWNSQTDNSNFHLNLQYNILNRFTIKTNLGFNMVRHNSTLPVPAIAQNPASSPLGQNQFSENKTQSLLIEPQIDYRYNIDKNHFHVLVGAAAMETNMNNGTVNVNNYINDLLINSRSGGIAASAVSNHSNYRYNSFFSRLHYNFDKRYILNISARRDGSSRFGPGKRFGLFGSVGAAWLFAEERIIKENLKWLSTGKLRGSYGTSGNDNIGDYAYLSVYNTVADYGNQKAIAPNQLANDNYHWEVNRKLEFATEMGFLNDRITMEVAWYRNRTDNQLIAYPLPATTGFSSYTANMPALVQNQGWELDLRINNIQNLNFTWRTSLNWARHRNKLLEFPNIERTTYANSLIIGESLNSFQRYRFIEVDSKTGHTVIEDLNGDEVFTARSSYNNQGGDYVNVGNFDPKWMGGMTNSIIWKNLNFDISFQYVKQSGYNIFAFSPGIVGLGQMTNFWSTHLDYWKEPGDIGKLPKPYASHNLSLAQYFQSEKIFSDASFFRLNNLSISYKIKNLILYTNAQNLLTITNYKGYDPENVSINSIRFPPLKYVVLGLKATF